MSKDPKVDKPAGTIVDDVFDLPLVEEEAILTGAAADAADLGEKLKSLPRILRVAMLIDQRDATIYDRLVADIATPCPGVPLTASFAGTGDPATAKALACELDRHAVADDLPELRHISDCVRLLTLPMQKDLAASEDYRRVTMTLFNAAARLPYDIDPQIGADIETFCVGWAFLPSLQHRVPRSALDGSAAGALVVAQVIGLTDLGHELNIELAAAWLAHGKQHSAEPSKFSDAEVVLMAAFEEHRNKGDGA